MKPGETAIQNDARAVVVGTKPGAASGNESGAVAIGNDSGVAIGIVPGRRKRKSPRKAKNSFGVNNFDFSCGGDVSQNEPGAAAGGKKGRSSQKESTTRHQPSSITNDSCSWKRKAFNRARVALAKQMQEDEDPFLDCLVGFSFSSSIGQTLILSFGDAWVDD